MPAQHECRERSARFARKSSWLLQRFESLSELPAKLSRKARRRVARARAASVPRRVRLRAESASRLQGSVVLFLQAERMHEELERAKNLGLESA